MDEAIADLLQSVRWHFYADSADPTALRRFHRDRRMLLYALTWPAVWLERRGLTCSPQRYRSLLAERLDAIGAHGDPARYGGPARHPNRPGPSYPSNGYFPRYLLKCLQDFFNRHGDDLYGELKHIRDALDQVLASARFAERVRDDARQLDILVSTHRLLHARLAAPVVKQDSDQLNLF